MKHVVAITEYLVKTVIVEADTEKDAIEKVQELYVNDGHITLDYEDFDGSNIAYIGEATQWDIENYMEIEV
jgi:hypothetical protein